MPDVTRTFILTPIEQALTDDRNALYARVIACNNRRIVCEQFNGTYVECILKPLNAETCDAMYIELTLETSAEHSTRKKYIFRPDQAVCIQELNCIVTLDKTRTHLHFWKPPIQMIETSDSKSQQDGAASDTEPVDGPRPFADSLQHVDEEVQHQFPRASPVPTIPSANMPSRRPTLSELSSDASLPETVAAPTISDGESES